MADAHESVAHPDGSTSARTGVAISSIDAETTAVVVVDVQRLFTDMVAAPIAPRLTDVLPAIRTFLGESRQAGAMVVLVRTVIAAGAHSASTLQWPQFMREGLMPGAPGTEFDPHVQAQPGDVEIVKQRYSAFFGTGLYELLQARGIDTVIVLGLTTNVCVQSTARDAWQHDFRTITLEDCCAEIGEGSHASSLTWTARNFGAVIKSTDVWQQVPSRPLGRSS